jgi:hypothetical protein
MTSIAVFKACKKTCFGLPERHGRHGQASRITINYQPTDCTTSRHLTMALQKIKLKKDDNLMKIMSEISAVEMRFKQSLREEKKVEVVQGCAGDNYAQIIVMTDGLSRIELQWNATALELC